MFERGVTLADFTPRNDERKSSNVRRYFSFWVCLQLAYMLA